MEHITWFAGDGFESDGPFAAFAEAQWCRGGWLWTVGWKYAEAWCFWRIFHEKSLDSLKPVPKYPIWDRSLDETQLERSFVKETQTPKIWILKNLWRICEEHFWFIWSSLIVSPPGCRSVWECAKTLLRESAPPLAQEPSEETNLDIFGRPRLWMEGVDRFSRIESGIQKIQRIIWLPWQVVSETGNFFWGFFLKVHQLEPGLSRRILWDPWQAWVLWSRWFYHYNLPYLWKPSCLSFVILSQRIWC